MSKLYFKYGCMCSGKSMFLLATAFNLQDRRIPFICLKSSIDDRDGECVIHSRALGDRDCIVVEPNDDIYSSILKLVNISNVSYSDRIKWILVDEAQFLTEKQVDELADIVDLLDINVVCYGLRTDFKTKLFPGSKRLFELADSIEEIKSTCSCGEKNIVNARINKDGSLVLDGEQVLVGGDDLYLSMCRKCFNRKKKNLIN